MQKNVHLSDLQSKPQCNLNKDQEVEHYQPSSGDIILTFCVNHNLNIPKHVFSKYCCFICFLFFLNFICLE